LPTGIELGDAQQEALADRYLDQFANMTGAHDLKDRIVHRKLFGPNDFVTRFHAYQASALGSSHLLRQSALFRTPNVSKKLPNLFYVGGNTVPGVGLPMCLIGAELVYERITGHRPEVRQ
jgi:phytoene dehydrogenase-like protein